MRALVAAAAAIAVGVAVLLVSESDTARDIGVPLGLVDDPPFAIKLSGPLWVDRTFRDGEGAPDVALVTHNEGLVALVAAPGRARIAEVELRVDGRVQRRVRPACPGGSCPQTLSVSFVPRLDPASGRDRRIQVVARDPAAAKTGADSGSHVSVATLSVRTVPRLPAVIEAQRPTLPVTAPPGAALGVSDLSAALRLFATARRTGSLRALLGPAGFNVRAAGTLRNGARAAGATLFLQLPVPRHNVGAIVPGYVAGKSSDGPYVPQAVELQIATLNDLLVDLDLKRQRILSLEPGPASVTRSWSRPDPSAHESLGRTVNTVVDAAARTPRLVTASDGGPAFLAYDGELSLDPYRRDWPVSLLFAGHANVGKVKKAFRRVGFRRRGSTHYLAYQLPGAGLRFDADRGLKTSCDAAATDVHLRFYAPAEVDHFQDPDLGSMVVATAHLDHADGCGRGTPRFGFSGVAERRVAAAAQRLGWRVQRNALVLGNAEPYRRDVRDPSHIWLGDGRATVIWVP